MTRAKIIVKGVVQGVGYRYYTVREAKQLGLHGTVRNALNGDVEITVEGEQALVLSLLKNLRIGPRFSHISDIKVEWHDPTNEFTDFRIVFKT